MKKKIITQIIGIYVHKKLEGNRKPTKELKKETCQIFSLIKHLNVTRYVRYLILKYFIWLN